MELIADFLLIAGAVATATYCVVLSRRLHRFTNLEKGVGGAIATLSTQVDDMNKALEEARKATNTSNSSLNQLTSRAEGVSQKLELLVASLHDLPINSEYSQKIDATEGNTALINKSMFQSRRSESDLLEEHRAS